MPGEKPFGGKIKESSFQLNIDGVESRSIKDLFGEKRTI